MDSNIHRALNDKLYEKRKTGALDLERVIRELVAVKDYQTVESIISQLCNDFAYAVHQPHARNGGLIGLAAAAIALGGELARYLKEIVPPVLACFSDHDARVRYYACEALYNIAKVAKGEILLYFNEIFDALCKLGADSELSVKNGAELLDRLIKDIVAESAATYVSILDQPTARAGSIAGDGDGDGDDTNPDTDADADADGTESTAAPPAHHPASDPPTAFSLQRFIPLLKQRIWAMNPFTRTFLIGWIVLLDSIPDLELVTYLPGFLAPLLKFLADDNRDVHVAAQACLDRLLDEIRRIAMIKKSISESKRTKAADGKRKREDSEDSQSRLGPDDEATAAPTLAEDGPSESGGGDGADNDNNNENDQVAASFMNDGDSLLDDGDGDGEEDEEEDWIPGQDVQINYRAILEILTATLDSPLEEDSLLESLRWIVQFLDICPEEVLPFTPKILAHLLPAMASGVESIRQAAARVSSSLMDYIVSLSDEPEAQSQPPRVQPQPHSRSQSQTQLQPRARTQTQPLATGAAAQTTPSLTSRIPAPTAAGVANTDQQQDPPTVMTYSNARGSISSVRDGELRSPTPLQLSGRAGPTAPPTPALGPTTTALAAAATALTTTSGSGLGSTAVATAAPASSRPTPFTTPPHPQTRLDYAAAVNSLTQLFLNDHEETRVAALTWLIMLHRKAPRKVSAFNNGTFPALLKTLSDPAEAVVTKDLKLLSQISRNSEDDYFSNFMVNLLQLFSTDRRLLETRGNLIIRQLCVSLRPERIYRALAECLEREDDVEFASIMVQNLNNNLITAPELTELRKRLRNLETKEAQIFFVALFRSWCYNAVATFSLCLLAQAYEPAYHLLQIIGELEMTVNILIQIDKLVQLIESPVFTYLRLQLLEPDKYPYLYKCLYGLLMLLPQSSAFAALKNRLNSVSAIGLIQSGPRSNLHQSTSSSNFDRPNRLKGAARDDVLIRWPEMLDKFRAVQDRARRARRQTGLLGNGNMAGNEFDDGFSSLGDLRLGGDDGSGSEPTKALKRDGLSATGGASTGSNAAASTSTAPAGRVSGSRDPTLKVRSGLGKQFGRLGGAVAGRRRGH